MKKLILRLAVAAVLTLILTSPTSAATPPDSCFAFNAGTGTITNYYDHEANNPANPACTRDVDIPSTIGGVAVTVIGPGAFNNNQLTAVTIPSGITSIGGGAFSYNQLSTVIIPNGVISIGNAAFEFNQLATTTIPDSVVIIGQGAFYQNQLTTVTIPSGVTVIGYVAFGYNQLTNVTIPNGVTTIDDFAFSSNRLGTVTIPSSVTSIGRGAFSYNQLTNVSIPGSVMSIDSEAFILQNQYGKNLERDNGIGPYLWSSDPVEVQAAYDEIWYAQLYTEDPTNPNDLSDGVVLESDFWGMDANENDADDSLGGHLINPASVEVRYENDIGIQLLSPLTSVGQYLYEDSIVNYYASQSPEMYLEWNDDWTDYTPESLQSVQDALAAYYRLNDTVSLTPPSISGYQTPASASFILPDSATQYTFVYNETTGPTAPTTPLNPSPPAPDLISDDQATANDGIAGESLAKTGTGVLLPTALSVASFAVGLVIMVANLRRRSTSHP